MSSTRHSLLLAVALALCTPRCGSGQNGHGDGGADGRAQDADRRDATLDGLVPDGSSDGGVSLCFPSRSCTSLHVNCGPIADGCGGVIDCGTCPAGQLCGGDGTPSVCGTPPMSCVPRTCADLHATCGPMGDGCGGMLDCGACTAGQTCGGGGVLSVCGTGGRADGGAADAGCSMALRTCATAHATCGPIGDGCGGAINCGTCPAGQTCGGGGTPSTCGAPSPCVPRTSCAGTGANCGSFPDGCGGSIGCGTCPAGQVCGATTPSVCGTPVIGCTPRTACPAGANCGLYMDGCGGTINCGTCPTGQMCGLGGMPNVCSMPRTCVRATTCPAGINCGPWPDGCGGLIASCGTCTAPDICGGGGVPSACGNSTTRDAGVPSGCAPGAHTTITGIVTAPGHDDVAAWGAPDPLPGAFVYVPGSAVLPFTAGLTCDRCGASVSGSPIVSATSAIDGTFTLVDPPCGTNIRLVIQLGLWRRQITIPSVACCASTVLTNAQTHLPRNHLEGDIPQIAIVTGSADPMECVLPKIGIDLGPGFGGTVNEFTNPSGTGRVRFYTGNGANITGATPPWTALYGSPTELSRYNLVIADCWGAPRDESAYYANLVNYGNSGGRIYASHFEYSMIHGAARTAPPALNTAWDPTAVWNLRQANPPDLDAFVVTSFPEGLVFSQWLQMIGASTVPAPTAAQIPVQQVRHDYDAVNSCGPAPYTAASACAPPGQLWMYADPAVSPNTPLQYTFDTPVGVPVASQCGRVMFSDFHVNTGGGGGGSFPGECSFPSTMTQQEKVLEFLLFDLTSCLGGPVCTPRTSCPPGYTCGSFPDGCGGSINCGTCVAPDTCGGGGTPSVCGRSGCTARTCGAGMCGLIGDGCGGSVNCGPCAAPDTCGGGGVPSVCGHWTCTPSTCPAGACGPIANGCGGLITCAPCTAPDTCGGGGIPSRCGHSLCTRTTCAAQSATCGLIADGCGATLDCGTCPPGTTCGGGGRANTCGSMVCTPTTCAAQGANCGPIGDGCGGLLDCGTCTPPDTCGGGGTPSRCGHAPCVPTTCAAQHANCGPIGDGCGGTLDCGGCDASKCAGCAVSGCTCGGGGLPSQCGCIG